MTTTTLTPTPSAAPETASPRWDDGAIHTITERSAWALNLGRRLEAIGIHGFPRAAYSLCGEDLIHDTEIPDPTDPAPCPLCALAGGDA